ncbi:MAG: universal stress protein [Planctomycetota bacterium]
MAANARREPYRRIIAAIDLSDETGPVVESAWTVAKVDGGEVRALFVLEPLPKVMARVARFREEERVHKAEAEIERLLDTADLLSEERIIRRIRKGHAGREILREAQEWNADLLVLGTHGFGFFDRLMLGSTSLYVLRHGHRAMLVVPRAETEGQRAERGR